MHEPPLTRPDSPTETAFATLIEMLCWRALDQADQKAYTFLTTEEEEQSLTYAELDRRSRAIAAMLQKHNTNGERVLLLYPPGLEYIVAFFGCLYAGAIAVPAYPPHANRSLGRIQAIVADAQARFVLTTSQVVSRIQRTLALLPDLQALQWMITDSGSSDQDEATWQMPQVTGSTLAFLQYTSGSTATPKGVMVNYDNLLSNHHMIQSTMAHPADAPFVSWLPLFHDMGLIGNILQALYMGSPCIFLPPSAFIQSPFRWLQTISLYRAHTSGAPNFAYDLCVQKITPALRDTLDLSSWKFAFCGAEPVRYHTLTNFAAYFAPCGFQVESLRPCYGLAEATVFVSAHQRGLPPVAHRLQKEALEHHQVILTTERDEKSLEYTGCGTAELDARIVIVDPETCMLCSPGTVGEIWVTGPHVAQGYWNRLQETEMTFRAYVKDTGEGPFLRTGDLGFLLDGALFVTGRRKDVIIIAGRNHYPQDIEQTVEQCHTAVRAQSGAAFSIDAEGEECLVLVQEIQRGYHDQQELDKICRAIRQAVAEEHDLPVQSIVLIRHNSIPKTSSGKIQRRACRQNFLDGELKVVYQWRRDIQEQALLSLDMQNTLSGSQERRGSSQVSVTDIMHWLVTQIAAHASVDPSEIDTQAPFSRYGLGSLILLDLVRMIEQTFNVKITISDLFNELTTIESLAASLAQNSCNKDYLEEHSHASEAEVTANNDERSMASPYASSPENRPDDQEYSSTLPLLDVQKQFWVLSQMGDDGLSACYECMLELRGLLNMGALHQAFQQVVDRHEALRTSISTDGKRQHVHQRLSLPLPIVDFSRIPVAEQTKQVEQWLSGEHHRGFDLTQAPLLRVHLLKLAAQRHRLVLSIHHIIMDGSSLHTLVEEVGMLYAALVRKAPCQLPPALPFSDVIHWQAQQRQSPKGTVNEAYWLEQFVETDPSRSQSTLDLQLPLDHPRPPVKTYRGAREHMVLEPAICSELKRISKEHSCTFFMLLLAAYTTLIHRLTGQDEVIVGIPFAGHRPGSGGHLIGGSADIIPIRSCVISNPTFVDFLATLKHTLLNAYEHQPYTLSSLMQHLLSRERNRTPVVSTTFTLDSFPIISHLGELETRLLPTPLWHTTFDLSMRVTENNQTLEVDIDYNTDLFNAQTIDRIQGYFRTLLTSIVAQPEQPLADLPMLTREEQQYLLTQRNAARRNYPQNLCVHQLFEQQVERTPDAVALVCKDEVLTYAELNRRANQLAQFLQGIGIAPEVCVGICMERSSEMIVGLLGVLKTGGAYLPLDPTSPTERLAFMVQDAQVAVLLTQKRLEQSMPTQSRLSGIPMMLLENVWNFSLPDEPPPNRASVENLAYVIYTSGSTGVPKGVQITQHNLLNLLYWHQETFSLQPSDRATQVSNPAFDATGWEVWPYLTYGASVFFPDEETRLSPPLFQNWLMRHQITVTFLPTPLAEQIMRLAWPKNTCLRFLLTGADTLHQYPSPDLPFAVINNYGPTEATVVATSGWVAPTDATQMAPSIGKPIANTEMMLLNERMQFIPMGTPGEMFIGGAGVARGYLNQPELTAAVFLPDPWSERPGARLYRTGDLARSLLDGTLEFLGRKDQQVKIRGHRIELAEIETILCQHPALQDGVVLLREDVPGDKHLVAYLVVRQGQTLSNKELRLFLQERLPSYMLPSAFVRLDSLPLTPNGKVDRRALPMPEALRSAEGHAPELPRTPIEELLVKIWSEVLSRRQVGLSENFFELGGHSLLATQLLARVRTILGVEIPLRTIFEAPTVTAFAQRVEQTFHTDAGRAVPPLIALARPAKLLLSFAQQRLWFLDQLEPESTTYLLSGVLHFQGDLSIRGLESCLQELQRRHEILRTTFVEHDGQPIQIIHPARGYCLPVIDLQGIREHEQSHLVQLLAKQEARCSCDLTKGPLLRIHVLRLQTQDHRMFLTMHHIITDGWSMGVLMRELTTLYRAFVAEQLSPLAPLPIQYADYALWQRDWLQGEELEAQLAYWKTQLANVQPLALPTDHPRPAIQTHQGAIQRLRLPSTLSEALAALSQQENVTLFMLLQATFQVLLLRYTGQSDISVGTPIANRRYAEIEGMIGFFVNTLVMRTDLSGNPTFQQVLQRVREVCLGAYAHQDIPFERVVEELAPERNLSLSPLFQVMLVLQNIPRQQEDLDGLSIRLQEDEYTLSKFDLTLSIEETGQGLCCALEYNTDLFEPDTIKRLLGHWQTLLEGVVHHPQAHISDLPLLTAGEQEQLLEVWNATLADYPQGLCVHQLVEQQVGRVPDAVALVSEDKVITYAELNQRANLLAHYLQEQGVGPEVRVGIYMERSVEMVVALLAVLKAGGAYLPLDPAYPAERLAFIMADSQVRLILTHRQLACHPSVADGRQIIHLETIWQDRARCQQENMPGTVLPENLAYLIYTSGSTGRPKGIMVTHRNVMNFLTAVDERIADPIAGIWLAVTSICFDISVVELLWTLTRGFQVVVQTPQQEHQSETLPAQILQQGITHLQCTPSLAGTLLYEPGRFPTLGSLQKLLLAGEALPLALARHLSEMVEELHNMYGPTETTIWSTTSHIERGATTVSIGRPLANTQVYILDSQGQMLPVGVPGELFIGGHGVVRGYVNQPEMTAEKFLPDPWSKQAGARLYRTGDIARYRPDGTLEFLGRRDQQVKVRGHRIELGEIEAVLGQHPAIQDVVVLAQTLRGTVCLVAYLVVQQGQVLTNGDLRIFLQDHLPSFMVPSAFVFLDALPLTPNGKIDRQALPMPEEDPHVAPGTAEATRTPIEELLMGLWQETLGRKRVGLSEDFFALGGHSLLATQLIAKVRAILGVEIPLRTIFEAPTVAALAQRVEQTLHRSTVSRVPSLIARERPEEIPLSFAQQRLWFLNQLEPGSTAYLLPHVLQMDGMLDMQALERCLQELISRHESLRTTFAMHSDQPVQVIHPAGSTSLPVIDLQGLRQEHREAQTQQLATQEAQQPCDLAKGPLLRTHLLRQEQSVHVLLLTLHHIITDGWSNGVLMSELIALYRAFVEGQPSPLAPLPVQYADFALWQRDWLQGEILEEQLAYWKTQLADVPPLALPTDRPRPAIQTHQGACQWLQLPSSLSEALVSLSQQEHVTLFMLLLATFQVLLLRYTGQKDISVGTPIANRRHAELEGVIGFFVNTQVMRTDLSDNPTFLQVLQRVREVCLEAYAHQDIPFEKLVEELAPERDLSRSPLFQVMLILQNTPQQVGELAGVRITPQVLPGISSKFDLTLSLVETEQGLHCTLEYNTDLFEADTIKRLLGHWQTLLEGVVHHPQAHVSELPLLTAGEQEQLLEAWNATRVDYPQHSGLHQLFEQQRERTPEAVAVLFKDEQVTYAELDRRANQLAHYLQGLGVGPEVLVGVCMERSLEMVIGLLAVLKAGGAYVPLDPAYPSARLAYMLHDAQVAIVLTQTPLQKKMMQMVSNVFCIDSNWRNIEHERQDQPEWKGQMANMAYLIYTSGSTGSPRGVIGTHQVCLNRFHWMWQTSPFSQGEICCQKTSLSFVDAVWEIFGPLLRGIPLVIIPDEVVKDPFQLCPLLERQAVTRIVLVPSLLRVLLEQEKDLQAQLGRLTYWVSSGEPLALDVARHFRQRLPDKTLMNLYGSSEVTADVTWYEVGQHELQSHVPIGRPIANTQVYLLDEALQLVPIGVPGEVFIGGANITRGYWQRSDLTAERFLPHPWSQQPGARLYRTGDLARYRRDGTLEFLGRKDQQVKIRGHRIEPGEIEIVLKRHPAVREAVVLARENASGEMSLVAYLVVQQEQALSSSSWHSYLQNHLPSSMLPSAFVLLDTLPLTPNGKVDRRALPAPRESQSNEHEIERPGTPMEELVGTLWCEVLGRTQVGVHDHFFESGGHSLLATQLVARVRAIVGVEVELRALFEEPTLAGLVRRVEQILRKSAGIEEPTWVQSQQPMRAVERPEKIPLSFAQQRLWFLDQLYPESTLYLSTDGVRLQGTLYVNLLDRSFQKMVCRHEILRTTFATQAGQPRQVIHASLAISVPVIDLRGLNKQTRESVAQQLVQQESQRPCDLVRGPLWRTYLLRLETQEHILLLTLHHIITDGWSNDVFARELTSLYRAYMAGQPSPLAPLPLQYADYALWQRQRLQGEILQKHIAYWQHRLEGVLPLELPADTSHATTQSNHGARYTFALPASLSQQLVSLSRQEGATPFMTLLAAFQILLYRLTGQEDIVVGTDSANRTHVETEELIGFFVNLLALRTHVQGASSFRTILQQVRVMVLEAYTHQELPFELVVEHLQAERKGMQTPLVQVLFVLQNTPKSAWWLPDINVETIESVNTAARFDLALFLQDEPDCIRGSLVYRTDIFREQTILTWIRRFEVLLQSIVANPEVPVDALEILTEEEKTMRMSEEEKPYRMYKHRLRNRKREALDVSTLRFSPNRPEKSSSSDKSSRMKGRETDANH
jgi:amino acid adenylation domain-containing protein